MSLIERLGLRAALSKPRTLRVYLGPQQLGSIIVQGRRPLTDSARSVVIDQHGQHWQASVDALREHLLHIPGVIPAVGTVTLEISLSSRWCQMVLAPWSDALLTEATAQRFLQSQLAAVYGDHARDWAVIADDAPYASPRLACGIERMLLQALQATAQDCGYRCRVIELALATALRAGAGPTRHRTSAPASALALIEPGRITMATLHAGHISAIQSQPCSALWQLELPQAWQRWMLRAPELATIDSVAVIDLCAPDNKRVALVPPPLPSRFRLVASPFSGPLGSPATPVSDSAREAA